MEIVIAAAILAGAYYFSTHGAPAPQATTQVPPPPLTATPYIPSDVPLSGSYQVTPQATAVYGGRVLQPGNVRGGWTGASSGISLGAASAVGLTSNPSPTTLPPPPPFVFGGISSGVGAGGNPLGGVLRPGVSLGTATTSISAGLDEIGAGQGASAAGRTAHWSGIQVIS